MRIAALSFVVSAFGLFFSTGTALALNVGDAAPCVVLENVQPDGTSVDECIRVRGEGQKFTAIEFFSITCSDCARNYPIIEGLSSEIEGTTKIRFVSVDRSRNAILSFRANHPSIKKFTMALDTQRDARTAYGVVATPTLFILDENDVVVFKHQGVLTADDVQTIKNLVAE
jgi:thiol-disulfide isomerase/thioredoxin